MALVPDKGLIPTTRFDISNFPSRLRHSILHFKTGQERVEEASFCMGMYKKCHGIAHDVLE